MTFQKTINTLYDELLKITCSALKHFSSVVLSILTSINQDGIISLVSGLLALLLPLVIFLMDKNISQILKWEKIVILQNVINPSKFLVMIACLLLPPLWWRDSPSNILNKCLVTVIFIGLVFYTFMLIRIYKWISNWNEKDPEGYQVKLRTNFLTDFKNNRHFLPSWQEVLSEKDANYAAFPDRLIFFKALFKLLEEKELEINSKIFLLSSFNSKYDSLKFDSIDTVKFFYDNFVADYFDTIPRTRNKLFQTAADKTMNLTINRITKDSMEAMQFFYSMKIAFDNNENKTNKKFIEKYGEKLIVLDVDTQANFSYWEWFPSEWTIHSVADLDEPSKKYWFFKLNNILFDEIISSDEINYQNISNKCSDADNMNAFFDRENFYLARNRRIFLLEKFIK